MKKWILTAIVGYLIFEAIEHLFLTLYWTIKNRGRVPACGPDAMPGRRCVVKQWQGTRGKVSYQNELWHAECAIALQPGSEARILAIDGLTLTVTPLDDPDSLTRELKSLL